MRILHAHKYHHERDGAGRYMFALMRRQAAEGDSVAAFAMQHPYNVPSPWEQYFVSELETERAVFGMGALRQAERALWSREAQRKMTAMLRAFSPDVVHVHNIYTHLSPSILAACERRGVPVVLTVHDYALVSANYALWDGEKPLPREHRGLFDVAGTRFIKGSWSATLALEMITRLQRMLRLYDRYVAQYVVPSTFVREELCAAGFPEKKMTLLAPMCEGVGEAARKDEGYVLFVGRLERYKGVHVLVQAMKALPDVELRIVGDGPERARLERLAKGMRNVRFDGFLAGEALARAYAGARAVAVPSLWHEPFGLVPVEAMLRGVPVIVSNRGALPETVEQGKSGMVFDPDRPKSFAEALYAIPEGMGERGRRRASALCSPVQHAAQIRRIYQGAVDNFS